jgi:hypothetical protein
LRFASRRIGIPSDQAGALPAPDFARIFRHP